MGLIASRLNFDSLNPVRRSQQDEPLYSYSLNKNYFSNFFLIAGERFEVNDPDYLFGDHCDLNFLSCTKPCSLPYKQAQQNLLQNLSKKQKSTNKTTSRTNRLGSPFSILTARRRHMSSPSKVNIEPQQESDNMAMRTGSDASQPLVMFLNIRKETLRLIKSSNVCNLESDLNSLTNSTSTSNIAIAERSARNTISCKRSPSPISKKSLPQSTSITGQLYEASASTSQPNGECTPEIDCDESDRLNHTDQHPNDDKRVESEVSSLVSASSVIRGGYVSVASNQKYTSNHSSDSDQDREDVRCGDFDPEDDDDDDDEFKDALNDPTNFTLAEENVPDKAQQQKSLLTESTKENRDIAITIEPQDVPLACTEESKDDVSSEILSINQSDPRSEYSTTDTTRSPTKQNRFINIRGRKKSSLSFPTKKEDKTCAKTTGLSSLYNSTSKIYNIEFEFDAEVDCSIRIYYFCTRELSSMGVSYKPQHATYKSKIYNYKRGLNQKFEQQEHTFQPYLFDEDLLIYKPLDINGNYNSGAVFPIVIHCVAQEGPMPRQSQSLVATIEKSQLDESYSIKTLKQLIFVDGVQYILQDIYGIEHKPMGNISRIRSQTASSSRTKTGNWDKAPGVRPKINGSINSSLNGSTMNLSETASLASIDSFSPDARQNRASVISGSNLAAASRINKDTSFECVVCMSEDRDTMLLPCRHLCLCSSCAQSLRYQANSCPICRCPFKAAISLSYRGS